MSRRYSHLVWDWNGTLLDDAWLCVEITNRLLAEAGLPTIDGVRYRQLFGFPLQDYTVKLGFAAADFVAVSDAFIAQYEARRHQCALRAGARQALETVRRAGLEQSVLSAYKQTTLDQVVEQRRLGPFFRRLIGVDNHLGLGKIENGRRWLKEMGWPPQEVVLAGDTLHDVEVAQAMGVHCLLIPSGHQSRQRLAAAGVALVPDLTRLTTAVCGGKI
ncbi:MAG: HAD hydrolase-like protein [Candidatus Latescibacteria bacterium]|nr:HAD hydrolase-like protein [Candidatus Latescibacterota bacterium]